MMNFWLWFLIFQQLLRNCFSVGLYDKQMIHFINHPLIRFHGFFTLIDLYFLLATISLKISPSHEM